MLRSCCGLRFATGAVNLRLETREVLVTEAGRGICSGGGECPFRASVEGRICMLVGRRILDFVLARTGRGEGLSLSSSVPGSGFVSSWKSGLCTANSSSASASFSWIGRVTKAGLDISAGRRGEERNVNSDCGE